MLLAEPAHPDEHADHRVGTRDHGDRRRDEPALLEGVLAEQEADRPDDADDVEHGVAERLVEPDPQLPGDHLHEPGRDAVEDAGGQGEREHPRRVRDDGRVDQAADRDNGEADRERHPGRDVDVGRRAHGDGPREQQEHREARRAEERTEHREQVGAAAGHESREDRGERHPGDEQRLHDRERPERQRHELQHERADRGHQPDEPHRAFGEVDQQSRAQRRGELHLFGGPLLRGARESEAGGAQHGGRDSDRQRRPRVHPPPPPGRVVGQPPGGGFPSVTCDTSANDAFTRSGIPSISRSRRTSPVMPIAVVRPQCIAPTARPTPSASGSTGCTSMMGTPRTCSFRRAPGMTEARRWKNRRP